MLKKKKKKKEVLEHCIGAVEQKLHASPNQIFNQLP